MPTDTRVSRLEFTVLMALLISILAISIDALLPALGVIGEALRVARPNDVQYVIGLFFLGLALGELLSGPLSDALGRKRTLYGSVALYLIGTLIGYFAATLPEMLIGRFVQGIGAAGPYVSCVSIVRDRYQGREMARVMSLVMMVFILVPAIAPSLGQAVLWIDGWRAIFILYIVYVLLIVSWVALRLPETLPPAQRIPLRLRTIAGGFAEVLRHKAVRLYTLSMGFLFAGFLGYLNSAQQVYQEHYRTGEAFTLYFGLLALVFGAASLLNARLVERLGMRYLCRRAIAVQVAASLAFVILLAAGYTAPLTVFLGYIGVVFFCSGLLFGNLNALAMEPMGHIAGIAAAVIGSATSLISMACGTLIGQAYNGTLLPLAGGFLVTGALSALTLMLADRKG